MQQLTSAMQAHLAQQVTTLATCWHITRRDATQLFFTDHHSPLTIGSDTYLAAEFLEPTAVTSQTGLAVDNLEVECLLSADAITRDDLLAGLYDHAELSVFMVNYLAPNDGKLHTKTGWLGQVTLRGGMFVGELRGITAALQQTIGEVYTPTCRAQLGDARCKKSLTSFTVTGTIDTVESVHAFTDAARSEANGYFTYGRITITSGNNSGISMEVRDFRDGRFGLFLPLPYPLVAGDSYTAVAGCDKRVDTCATRFSNTVNFRGEPHLPGNDRLFETAATRSS